MSGFNITPKVLDYVLLLYTKLDGFDKQVLGRLRRVLSVKDLMPEPLKDSTMPEDSFKLLLLRGSQSVSTLGNHDGRELNHGRFQSLELLVGLQEDPELSPLGFEIFALVFKLCQFKMRVLRFLLDIFEFHLQSCILYHEDIVFMFQTS
jgi:hypothetical protein